MNLNNGIEREKLLIIRLSMWRRSNSMITGYTRKRMRREKNKFPARYAQIKSQMRLEIREFDMRSDNSMAAQSFEPLWFAVQAISFAMVQCIFDVCI